ncbi:hypothetical protein RDABS01_011891 [Bienertia sinuspersici]
MADTSSTNRQREPSRLQRRAPASIQVNRTIDWNVAIPLLSPLDSSSSSINRAAEIQHSAPQVTDPTMQVVFKKWQHPAAPFYYDYDIAPSVLLPPFGSFHCPV